MFSKRQRIWIKIASLVILFVLRIRFPKDKSIAHILRKRYGEQILRLQRKTERLDQRLQKAKLDLEFLLSCLNNDLIPHFLKFRLANARLRRSDAYSACQRRFLLEEIHAKRSSIRILSGQMSTALQSLSLNVSTFDFVHLSSKLAESNRKSLSRQRSIQERKFEALQREQSYISNDPDKVIHNFSSHVLTDLQRKLLCKGLNFSLPPKKLVDCDYIVPFELLYRTLAKLPVSSFQPDLSLVHARLKDVALSSFYVYNAGPKPSVLTKAESAALKDLVSVKDLIIQKADKGNSVVLFDRNDYVAKMMTILSDRSKFVQLHPKVGNEFNFVWSQQNKLRRLLNSLQDKGVLSPDLYKKLAPTGSQPGRMYGLGNVHKPGTPLRPILSTIGTPSYQLAKFLVPILSPITVNEYTVKDSFSFAREINSVNPNGLFMASLDVKSLFTNIPLNETVDICVDQLFNSDNPPNDISRKDFRRLLQAAVKDNFFIFDSKWYKQVDGVAMGSPLGPTLANAFLCFHEKRWLEDCPVIFKPVMYRRYVDDTFLLFKDPCHLPLFLDYMNSHHASIEFTSECESNGSLSFLDVLVSKSTECFCTSLFRKPTFSGVYSNFDSFIQMSYKFGLVSTLLFRAHSLCSSYVKFHEEIVFLKSVLSKNGYPTAFLDCVVKKFLDKLFASKKLVVDFVENKSVCVILPYMGLSSIHVRDRIVKLCKQQFPQLRCKVVLKPTHRLSDLFPFKDRLPAALKSSVVYKFQCGGCKSIYYGKSIRHLHTRVCEHAGSLN